MTNLEYYNEEILKIDRTNYAFGILGNKPISCTSIKCCECELNNINYSGSCSYRRIVWSHKEHVEKPRLTKKEKMFCELVETGYICRDNSGDLWWFQYRPHKTIDSKCWTDDGQMNYMTKLPCKFSFIQWEDEEPWKVEELLKLEVEE